MISSEILKWLPIRAQLYMSGRDSLKDLEIYFDDDGSIAPEFSPSKVGKNVSFLLIKEGYDIADAICIGNEITESLTLKSFSKGKEGYDHLQISKLRASTRSNELGKRS